METNPNKLCLNSNPPSLNNPALNGGPPPVAPLGELSSGVQQVHAAHNPIPLAVQDLLQLNPGNRVRSILNLAATTQQDDYFSDLAQNKSLDEKSRLLAASKILCPARRDTLLTQLENDSEEQNALLTTARDQSLEANIRLNAAAKLSRGNRREEILAEFAQDRALHHEVRWQAVQMLSPGETRETVVQTLAIRGGMDCWYRLSAAQRITSAGLREETLDELARILSPDYRLAAARSLISADSRNAALLPLAYNEKLGIKLRFEAVTMITPGPRRQEALQALLSAAKTLEPSKEREAVLLALTSDHSLDIQDRLDAANALAAGNKRQEALLAFAQNKRLNPQQRLDAAGMLERQ